MGRISDDFVQGRYPLICVDCNYFEKMIKPLRIEEIWIDFHLVDPPKERVSFPAKPQQIAVTPTNAFHQDSVKIEEYFPKIASVIPSPFSGPLEPLF